MSAENRNAPLCIAHVSLSLEIGGLEKLLVEYARLADRERFQLHFLCLRSRGKLADQIESLGWPVQALGDGPGFHPLSILKLARLLRRLRIDVAHTHNPAPCLYAVPAARLARVPLVLNTWHGPHMLPRATTRKILALTSRLAHRVTCVSKDCAAEAIEIGVPRGRVTTIWNGIEIAKYPFRGPCPQGPAIVVAQLNPKKSIDTLIRVLPQILKEIPEFRLRIVGDGASRTSLEALTAELGLQAHVEFVGEVRNVPEQLAQASMFVMPSLTEGISLAILEAMSVGLPAVAMDAGGNREIINDGETGMLISPPDPGAMAKAIVQLAADPGLACRMGAAGRRRVEEHFDVRAMVRAYEALYAEGLGRRGGGKTTNDTNSTNTNTTRQESERQENKV